MATPRGEVLSVFRSLLRSASKFSDYNVREYVKRRTIDAFREKKGISDPSSVASALGVARYQMEVAKRQAVVYSLYIPEVKSVMEIRTSG